MVGADGGDNAGAGDSGQKRGCHVVGSGLKGKDIECSSRGRWSWKSDEWSGFGRETRMSRKLWSRWSSGALTRTKLRRKVEF